jgi:hypothetical protein
MEIEDHMSIAPCAQTWNDHYMGRTEKRHVPIKWAAALRGAGASGVAVLSSGIAIGDEAFIVGGRC